MAALDATQSANGLLVLTRLAQREPQFAVTLADAVNRSLPEGLPAALTVARREGTPMTGVLLELVRSGGLDVAVEVQRLLPADSASLRLVAAAALERITSSSLRDDVADSAALLTDYAERLYESGSPRAAQAVADRLEALLAEHEPLSFDLLMIAPRALRVISRCQARSGRADDAVRTAERYLEVELFTYGSAPVRDVALALGAAGNRLLAAGRTPEAASAFESAASILTALINDRLWYIADRVEAGEQLSLMTGRQDALTLAFLLGAGQTEAEVDVYDPGGETRSAVFDVSTTVIVDGTPESDLRSDLGQILTALAQCQEGEQAIATLRRSIPLLTEAADADEDRRGVDLGTSWLLLAELLDDAEHYADAWPAARSAVEYLGRASRRSGGAVVEEYARALRQLMVTAMHAGRPLGEANAPLAELVAIYGATRIGEVVLDGVPLLSGVSLYMDRLVRLAEQTGDIGYALEISGQVEQLSARLHEADPRACQRMTETLILRSRLLMKQGDDAGALAAADEAKAHREHRQHRAEEPQAEAAEAPGTPGTPPEEAAPEHDYLVDAVLLNTLAMRRRALGDDEGAGQAAREGLALLAQPRARERIAADRETWLMTLSFMQQVFFSEPSATLDEMEALGDLVAAWLEAAPVPPMEDEYETLTPLAGLWSMRASAMLGDAALFGRTADALVAAMARPGFPLEGAQQFAPPAYEIGCELVDAHRELLALRLCRVLHALTLAHPGDVILRVEYAKLATEVIMPLHNAQRWRETYALLQEADAAMRSAEYLDRREQDLGQPRAEFLASIDDAAASLSEYLAQERSAGVDQHPADGAAGQ